jgi:hypothetical protein
MSDEQEEHGSLFDYGDVGEAVETMNSLEHEYQMQRKLPIHEHETGFVLLLGGGPNRPKNQMVVGKVVNSFSEFVAESVDEFKKLHPDAEVQGLDDEDWDRMSRLWEEAVAAAGMAVKCYYTGGRTHVHVLHRVETIPISEEQFNAVVMADHSIEEVREMGWFRTLIKDWSWQMNAEFNAKSPVCPECGSRAWNAVVESVGRWATTVVQTDRGYAVGPPDPTDSDLDGGMRLIEMYCVVCTHTIEHDPDLKVGVAPEPFSML